MTDTQDAMALQADAEALDWILALQEAPDDAALRTRFQQWRCASALNAAAWEETAQVYAGIGETEPKYEDRWSHLQAGNNAPRPWIAHARRYYRRSAVRQPRRRLKIGLGLSAVAAAVLGIVAAPELAIRWQASAIAGTGEVRELALEDGSHAYLSPGTAVRIAFSTQERQITLLRGAAWFDVKHRADRPFQVLAGNVTATDIGTAFEVAMPSDQVRVAVEHGIVQVAGDAQGRPISERLTAGQSISVGPGSATVRQQAPAALIGAWRDGQIAVQNQPMSEVVEALRPWHNGLILIRSDRLARKRVTGIYDLRHPADAMRALAKAYGGKVTQLIPWILVLSES